MAVLEHIREVRGVAADFAGTILAVRAQCVQHTTDARVMQQSPRSKQRHVSMPRGDTPEGVHALKLILAYCDLRFTLIIASDYSETLLFRGKLGCWLLDRSSFLNCSRLKERKQWASSHPGQSYALETRTLLWFVIVCSRNTNVMKWFGQGGSGNRMLWKHERYYGLGMEALVIVCSRNTNVILVWAWMLRQSYALLSAGPVLGFLQRGLLCSQIGLPVPLHGQLHGVCLHPVRRPTIGLHDKKSCVEDERSAAINS